MFFEDSLGLLLAYLYLCQRLEKKDDQVTA